MSQRVSSGNSGSQFEDFGDLLNQAVGVPAAQVAPSTPAPPAMATPVGLPVAMPVALPSSIPPAAAVASPYAAPMKQSKNRGGNGRAMSNSVVQPLYEARMFIKIFGWAMFLLGIFQFLAFGLQTIALIFASVSGPGPGGRGSGYALGVLFGSMVIGFIFPFVTTYLGWQIKGAGRNLTVGVETGDQGLIQMACQQMAAYFRVMGILALIGLVMLAIGFLFIFLGALVSFAG